MLPVSGVSEDTYLVMVTKHGEVKRMASTVMKNIRSNGIRAMNLDEGDELIFAAETHGGENILIATKDGMSICFSEDDVRPMGRDAGGVRGIKLREGDECIGAGIAFAGKSLLTVTENGFGKRTLVEEYLRGGGENGPQNRGGLGVRNCAITEKTGKAAAAIIVSEEDDVFVISDDGTIIRMPASTISLYGRGTQGVRIMRLDEGSHVISLASTAPEEEETEENEDNA